VNKTARMPHRLRNVSLPTIEAQPETAARASQPDLCFCRLLLRIGWKTGTTSGYDTEMDDAFFVYILASKKNGTLYIGVTNNLARRLTEHKAKLVPGFTRKYQVDQLVYFEAFSSILAARAREHALKRWRRAWKIALIEKLNPDWQDLTDRLNS
jgi:putative endonuclease